MEYMLFICSDPSAPKYVAAEDNIVAWGALGRLQHDLLTIL